MTILKTFVNGSKIPLISPLLVNNEFLTGFLDKANLFNDFFREQGRPITNNSSLPNNQTIETVTRLSEIYIGFLVKPQTSDIRMIYENIRVTYEWHTSTYEWYLNDIRVHTSDISVTYEYMRVAHDWHAKQN